MAKKKDDDLSIWKSIGIICLIVSAYAVYTIKWNADQNAKTQKSQDNVAVCSVDAGKLLEKINAERSKLGAPELVIDAALASASKEKVQDMETKGYFSHEMPEGEWDGLIRDKGVDAAISEDIGSNDSTPENSWKEFKESPDHYESLTNPAYTRVGIATKCTNFTIKIAVTPEDNQYIGDTVTDLTVITLAEPEEIQ